MATPGWKNKGGGEEKGKFSAGKSLRATPSSHLTDANRDGEAREKRIGHVVVVGSSDFGKSRQGSNIEKEQNVVLNHCSRYFMYSFEVC